MYLRRHKVERCRSIADCRLTGNVPFLRRGRSQPKFPAEIVELCVQGSRDSYRRRDKVDKERTPAWTDRENKLDRPTTINQSLLLNKET